VRGEPGQSRSNEHGESVPEQAEDVEVMAASGPGAPQPRVREEPHAREGGSEEGQHQTLVSDTMASDPAVASPRRGATRRETRSIPDALRRAWGTALTPGPSTREPRSSST
jgi:hypothetical protein